MHQPHQHTHKELAGKIRQALEAFDNQRIDFAEPTHVDADIDELHLADEEEYLDLIYECLQLAQEDPLETFRPPNPPKSTKHALTKNLPMWAFEVQHESYPFNLYFKFCLKEHRDGTLYCHIDCHESRPKNHNT